MCESAEKGIFQNGNESFVTVGLMKEVYELLMYTATSSQSPCEVIAAGQESIADNTIAVGGRYERRWLRIDARRI